MFSRMVSGDKWASRSLCKEGERGWFVALSNGGEYVRCTDRSCDYFWSVKDLPTYERAVQLNVSTTFIGKDSLLSQHKRPCALRVSHSGKNPGKSYFGCKECLLWTVFCWADLELNLRCSLHSAHE